MATSVSSERAFSQGGITISKRRSCLKGDIVEALQHLKCAVRNDLLFREAAPSSRLEVELKAEDEGAGEESEPEEERGWEELVIDIDDDMGLSDFE
jgi:hypothetical protein